VTTGKKNGVAARVSHWLETVGAVALFAMMAVTFIDIAGRSLLNRPLAGSTDLIQVLLLVTAACLLPSVTLRSEHLSIELFNSAQPTAAERFRRAATALVVALVFAAVAVLMWRHGAQTAHNQDLIGYLRIPVSPFVYAMSGLCLVSALTALSLIPGLLRKPPPDQEAAAQPHALEPKEVTP
jgi:TRAP-type transport system small permease protein